MFVPPLSKQMAALAFRKRLMGVQHRISVLQCMALLAELQEFYFFSELLLVLSTDCKMERKVFISPWEPQDRIILTWLEI